jgi:hypothetical protein
LHRISATFDNGLAPANDAVLGVILRNSQRGGTLNVSIERIFMFAMVPLHLEEAR